MQNLGLILLTFAFVLACVAARVNSVGAWTIGWIAIACWIASELVGGLGRSAFLHP